MKIPQNQCLKVCSKKFISLYWSKSPKKRNSYKKVRIPIKKCVLVGMKKNRTMINTESKKHSEYIFGGKNNGTF